MAETYQTIKDFIKTKLDAITSLQEVSGYPELDFKGYPAVVLIPLEGDGDYETNVEDERSYIFSIHVYYKYEQVSKVDALDRTYDAIDDILDSFAEDKDLSGISLPAKKLLIGVEPVHAGWEEIAEQSLIRSTIELNVRISVDNT